MSALRRVLCWTSCAAIFASCASPSRPPAPPLAPAKLFEGGYINVRSPNADGWRLVESSPRGMAFGKTGMPAGETLAAQVLMFDLQPTGTPDQFVDLIREGAKKDTDPKRFDTIESSTNYTTERGYPCVRHHGVFNDKAARTSPTAQEPLILEVLGLYCRHPVRTQTGFAAIYSYRGPSRYAPLGKEAQEFIQGVQVPPPNPS